MTENKSGRSDRPLYLYCKIKDLQLFSPLLQRQKRP